MSIGSVRLTPLAVQPILPSYTLHNQVHRAARGQAPHTAYPTAQ
jgi:hypothetical protein